MYNTAYSAFTDALKREGKVITAYSDNASYNVLFRRNNDTNQLTDRLTIFYSADCGINAGQMLTYGNKHFLALNQETPESDIYFKSNLIETNAIIHSVIGSNEINMPVYAYDIADGLAQTNNVMSLISGNIHIIAEPNSIIKSLALNNQFDAVGRHWKIDNIISKDNVIHLYCEVAATTAHTYTVTITANDSYHRGESAQLTAVAKQDDTVVNASLVWTSSDTSLATVDNTGLVKFLADGNVTITATWTSQSVSGTKAITITEPDSYSLSITANDSYTTSDTPTLTATAQKNGTTDSTATITWTSSDTSIATIDSTGKVTFLAAGSVTFTATWTQQNITATKSITVTQADIYSIEIQCDDTYTTDDTPTIIVVGKHNGTVVDTANIYVTSSDNDVAMIDANNKVTFLKAGTVTFTAAWNNVNVKTTKTVTVTQAVVYALTFNNINDSYLLTDTPTLTAVATADGVKDTTATITWTSSDTNVATIDPNTGLVTFISAGTVIFSAHWTEHNITKTSQIVTVTSGEMTCTIEGNTTIIANNTYNVFTAHFWNGSTELTDITEEWTVAIPSGWEERITYAENAENNQVWIKADNNWASIDGKTMDLTLKDSNHTCSTTITITFQLPG